MLGRADAGRVGSLDLTQHHARLRVAAMAPALRMLTITSTAPAPRLTATKITMLVSGSGLTPRRQGRCVRTRRLRRHVSWQSWEWTRRLRLHTWKNYGLQSDNNGQ